MAAGRPARRVTLLDVPTYTQYVARGLLIFAAVLLNRARNTRSLPT